MCNLSGSSGMNAFTALPQLLRILVSLHHLHRHIIMSCRRGDSFDGHRYSYQSLIIIGIHKVLAQKSVNAIFLNRLIRRQPELKVVDLFIINKQPSIHVRHALDNCLLFILNVVIL